MMHEVTIPGLKTTSGDNARTCWRARARKAKRERRLTGLVLGARRTWRYPIRVTLTRIAPRRLDTGGLWSALKGVQDEVAAWLGVDDGVSERRGTVEWKMVDVHEGVRVCGVRIRIEEVDDGEG